MRKGTLSDQQTLTLYNNGESAITLAVHEGMSVLGLYGRLTRARKNLGMVGMRRPPSDVVIDSAEALDTALRALNRAIRNLKKALV